jgi:hypothetical protein
VEAVNSLSDFWGAMPLDRPPYIHPQDLEALNSAVMERQFDFTNYDLNSFIGGSRFGDFDDNRFHLSLLPTPYIGSIESADIVILQLNPGFQVSNLYAEHEVAGFREIKKSNILQRHSGVEHPFFSLDPKLCWYGGYQYWERRFRKVALEIARRKFGGDYQSALKALSKRVLCLELVAYHSASFPGGINRMKNLPSAIAVRNFVKSEVEQSALAGDKLLIVMRAAKIWGIEQSSPNVIVYRESQARGARLSRDAETAILHRVVS